MTDTLARPETPAPAPGATRSDSLADRLIETQAPQRFRLAQIADALPDISQATIRDVLENLRSEGQYTVGRGRSAMWERTQAPPPPRPGGHDPYRPAPRD